MKSETPAAKAVEKTLHGKVPKRTFPRSLEIPQTTRDSHFSHSLDCYWVLFALWTHWLRPKPAKMAPFFTVADIFVDGDVERQCDLLGDSRTAPVGIALLDFDDGTDEFCARSFRA